MESWCLENNIILRRNGNEIYYISASDLFGEASSKYLEQPLDCSSLSLRTSKIGLQVNLSFEFEDNKIHIILSAIKANQKYVVPFVKGNFLDYTIVNGAIHYLTGFFDTIKSIVESSNLESNIVDLPTFMNFKRECIKQNLIFDDSIEAVFENKKEETSDFTPNGLVANLFSYQTTGCNWMSFMAHNGCGCILGDEMGLGKTLQIIALFGHIKEWQNNSKFLVICPVSLLENWKREINKFYPSLKVNIHHGSNRTGDYNDIIDFDVNIVSYSNAQTDLGMLNMIHWSLVVIDEAQSIKNPKSNRAKNIKLLNRDLSIAVTGTPFENHMTDIWSIVDFVFPNYLGDLASFNYNFPDSIESAISIEKLISPIMIRRRVKDVAKDLPPRIDIPQPIIMTKEEAKFYEAERIKDGDLSELKSVRIDKIQKLRMYCTHPLVYDKSLGNVDPCTISNKYSRLCEILEEIFEKGEKAIVFTSFNEMINIITKDVKNRYGVYTNYINGSINASTRQSIIDEFSDLNGSGILVLNPKAAGAGLNITTANHVIHYNLEWNPAIEDQASARAYRRGQEKTVFVHRLFYANTLEDYVNNKIQSKRDISDTAIVGNIGDSMTTEDLIRALTLTPVD